MKKYPLSQLGNPRIKARCSSFNICFGIALSAIAMLFVPASFAANGNDTWLGNTDTNWGTAANWSPAVNAPPTGGDWLSFGAAGSSGTTLYNNLGGGTNFAGITFNSGASSYTFWGNSIVLAGGITNSSTATQIIGFAITNTSGGRPIVTTVGGGNVTINGGLYGSGGSFSISGGGNVTIGGTANTQTGTTTVTNAVLILAANNALPIAQLSLLGAAGNSPCHFDLNGFNQVLSGGTAIVGTDANNETATGCYVTNSSATLATLTLANFGNNYQFREGNFGGNLELVFSANNLNNDASPNPTSSFQMQVPGNTYSGGTVVSGIGTTPLTTTNLNPAGGYGTTINTNTTILRFNNNGLGFNVFGSGPITLDNGELWETSAFNFTNPISVTARGAILHMENNGDLYLAPLTGSGLVCLSGKNNSFTFSNDLSGFNGTLAIDTASSSVNSGVSSVSLCSNSPAGDLLFWGSGSDTGILQWNGNTSQPVTLSFTRVNYLAGSTPAIGRLSCGNSSTVTYMLGDNTATTNNFGGIVQNGSGAVGVTKIGSDTQILSGLNSYTNPTYVGGGTLVLSGANNGGGGCVVSNGATLSFGGTGSLTNSTATVNVQAGGTLAGGGAAIGGLVTLSSGNAAINLQDNVIDTLTLSNGLTLNNGNILSFDLGSSADSIAIVGGTYTQNSGTITVNVDGNGFSAGIYPLITGASITSTSGFVLGSVPSDSSFTYALVANSGDLALQVSLAVVAPSVAYWKGGVNNDWSTADSDGQFNWSTNSAGTLTTGAKPGVTTAVTFSASGAANQNTVLGGNFEIASLAVTTSGNVGIGGANSLQLDSGGLTINSGAGNVTITNASVVLGGTQLWTNNSADTLTISAPISGLSVLTLGGGTTVWSGTNSHGGTTITAGSLTLSNSATLGSSSAFVGAAGGTINLGGSAQTVGTVSIVNGGVITNGAISGTSYDLESGAIAAVVGGGSGVLAIKSTTNTVILSANNTFSGSMVVSNGTLQIGAGGATGSLNENNLTVSNDATFIFNSSESQTNNGLISGTGSLVDMGGGSVELTSQSSSFSGNILVNGSTLMASAGNNAVNAHAGPLGSALIARTIIVTNGGALSLLGGNVLGSGSSTICDVTTVINQGGQLILNANDANILGPVFLNGSQMSVGNGYDSSYQGAILLGSVTVGGTNSSTIIANGTNSADDGVMLGYAGTQASANLNSTGGLIPFVVNSTGASNADLTVSASLVDPANSPAVGGTTAGNGGIYMNGTGTMLLTAINPYTGPTIVAEGNLIVSSIQGATGMTNYAYINDGAGLGVMVSGNSQWAPSSITLGVSAGATLEFTDLDSTNIAPLNPGDFSINGTATINIASVASAVGTYPLVNNYDGSGSLVLGSLPSNVQAASLTNSNGTIELVVTQVSGPSLTRPTLTHSVNNGTLTLSWPSDNTGYTLQVQTNSLSTTNWVNWPGATTTNSVQVPINPTNGSVFFRLVYP